MSRAGTPHRRRSVIAVLVMLTVVVPAGCSVEHTLPPPHCTGEASSLLIVAQSVPTASQIPCLLPLPTGWSVATVHVDEHHTAVALDSDRAGESAAVLRLERQCDVTGAVSAPSELPAAARHELIEQVDPSFRAERSYVFPGGCVSWTFDFDKGVSATHAVAIGDTLALVPRRQLNDDIRETFVDEEI